MSKKPRTIKYDLRGNLKSNGVRFTDRDILKDNYSIKIHILRVWLTEVMIKGFQAVYQMSDGALIEGKLNAVLDPESESQITLFSFELDNFDYLKSIGGGIGEKGFIEYLFMASCNGRKAECGEKREKQKKFNLNILGSEVPICLNGFLTTLKGI